MKHFIFFTRLSTYFFALVCFSSVGYASSEADNVHFCLPFESEGERDSHQYVARKQALNLNVGEPRTVRLIYFLPNDRSFNEEVVQNMKAEIRNIQTFYAEQMQAYGNKTFRFETDAQGEPLVHRVDGQHPDSHYLNNTYGTVAPEINKIFNVYEDIYFTVIDNSTNLISRYARGVAERERSGGIALFPGEFSRTTAAHELGHVFGLEHDFRNNAYIMSYGPGQDRLSACNAEFLAASPYFNPDTPPKEAQLPTIELISPPEYPIGSKSVSIQFKVSDSEGLHQVILFVKTTRPHLAAGFPEVKACRGLTGERDAVVEFEYDGVIPSVSGASLSYPTEHPIYVTAIDTDGNVIHRSFELWEIPPQRITTLEGHTSRVRAVAFSPDRTMLASGSEDKTVRLWNIAGEHIATILGGDSGGNTSILSLAFSPDGTTLASGARDNMVRLWDVATKENIATLRGHTNWVTSVSFSPDGTTFASGSYDGSVLLWDMSEYVMPVANIPDANLRAVIRDALGKSRFAPIIVTDMASLTTLDASNRNIRDLTGLEFATSLAELNLTDNPLSSQSLTTHIPALQERGVEVLFDRSPSPDFDGNGTVGVSDFLLFVDQFGLSQGDAGYDARFDLDGNGIIGISDFLLFVDAFGKEVS